MDWGWTRTRCQPGNSITDSKWKPQFPLLSKTNPNSGVTPQMASRLLVTVPRSLKSFIFYRCKSQQKNEAVREMMKSLESIPEDQLRKTAYLGVLLGRGSLQRPSLGGITRLSQQGWARKAVAEGPTGLKPNRPWATETVSRWPRS